MVGLNLGNSLPVTLASFSGEVNGKVAELNWRTEAEEMTDRFVVERRVANGGFVAIGSVAAAGNASQVLDYAFTDSDPARGANDYRLRMIDQDGSFEFSGIVTLKFRSGVGAELRQVVPGQLRLSGAEAGAEYLFTNAAGAVIRRGSTGGSVTTIDANGLPAGVYFLMLREPVAGAQTLRVVLR